MWHNDVCVEGWCLNHFEASVLCFDVFLRVFHGKWARTHECDERSRKRVETSVFVLFGMKRVETMQKTRKLHEE